MSLARAAVAEFVGTAWLLIAVVGSGIMGERLAGGNIAIALLANSIATGGALVAILLTLGPVSGAHLNPVVTMAAAWRHACRWRDVPALMVAQVSGACAGVAVADVMFGLPALTWSTHARNGWGQALSEAIATFGLLLVIKGVLTFRQSAAPFAVAAYITAAYWYTASTSFANPAVTLARSFTDTFAGIRPSDVPVFVVAQCAGAAAAVVLGGWLIPDVVPLVVPATVTNRDVP